MVEREFGLISKQPEHNLIAVGLARVQAAGSRARICFFFLDCPESDEIADASRPAYQPIRNRT
jgi:hypothetical protein